jgi:hypothetical protein
VTGVTSFLGVLLIVMLAPAGVEVRCNLPTGSRPGIWGTEGRAFSSAQHTSSFGRSFDLLDRVLFIFISSHEIAVGKVCKEDHAQEESVEVGLLGPVGV